VTTGNPDHPDQACLDSFVVVEKWESLDALKAHAASPHMASYAAKTRDMIASRVIHVFSPAG
jgi:quinol monooxygenase YgiN